MIDEKQTTARQRWYAYWHAKRAWERHQDEMLAAVWTFGCAFETVDKMHPAHEYVARAIDMAINPPMIYDPILGQIWKPNQPQLKAGHINKAGPT